MKTDRIKTWMGEQTELVVILAFASYKQLQILDRSPRAIALVLLSAAAVLAGQKVRSMADRQREADAAHGREHAPMSCAPRVAFWGAIAQFVGAAASLAVAPTWLHVALALWIALYPLRRRVYRAWHPRLAVHHGSELIAHAPDGEHTPRRIA